MRSGTVAVSVVVRSRDSADTSKTSYSQKYTSGVLHFIVLLRCVSLSLLSFV
jgi:hypothetical protein